MKYFLYGGLGIILTFLIGAVYGYADKENDKTMKKVVWIILGLLILLTIIADWNSD